MNNNKMKRLMKAAGLVLGGLLVGWLLFGGGNGSDDAAAENSNHPDHIENTVWTCSMHPQIKQDEPGLCPICAMDLVPLDNSQSEDSPAKLEMTDAAVALANIRTSKVRSESAGREVSLNGKVQADERNISVITARFGGRIERLYVNFTGQTVSKGQKLAAIYSPALIAAQQELLEAAILKSTSPAFYEAAKRKLKLWNLSDAQIDDIEKKGATITEVDIVSPMTGTVLERFVEGGDYVSEGKSLFEIANLANVWIMFEAYETDLSWIRKGNKISFSVRSVPGKIFNSSISFIDPIVDPSTRVAFVRAEFRNNTGELKPGMFARGSITSSSSNSSNGLVVPKSAVLWTGERSVVYVRDEEATIPTFEYREIVLGPESDDSFVVRDGLQEGERVVTNGVFTVDAAAQLQGKQSMMNVHSGHEGESGSQTESAEMTVLKSPAAFKKQMSDLYSEYLILAKSFVQSDAKRAKSSVKKFSAALGRISDNKLQSKTASFWLELSSVMKSKSKSILASSDLEVQRSAFSGLSNAMYKAVKQLAFNDEVIYYQYCPMAFNDKGAYWLSKNSEIENPYFGDKMMKCGLTKETLK